jgi:hypothetical protein
VKDPSRTCSSRISRAWTDLPVNTLEGKILKMLGGTRLGAYGSSISPLSSREATAVSRSFQHAGGKIGVVDSSLPYGGMEFTNQALVARQKHVNAVFPAMIVASNLALATLFKQGGRSESRRLRHWLRPRDRALAGVVEASGRRFPVHRIGLSPSPTPVPSRWLPRRRSTRISRRLSFRRCSSTRPGPAPIS